MATTTDSAYTAARTRPSWVDVLGVVLLTAGSVLLPLVGWLAGVVVIATSPRFRRSDRLMALLAPPLGLLLPLFLFVGGAGGQSCYEESETLSDGTEKVIAAGCDAWAADDVAKVVVFVLSLVLAVWTAARLTKRLRVS